MIWNELKELQKLFDDYIFSEPLKLLLTYEIRYNQYIKPLQTIHIQYKIIHMNMELLSILKTAFAWDCSGWAKSMKSGNHLIFFLLNLMHIGCQ